MGLDMYLYMRPKSMTKEQWDKESDSAWEKGIDNWRENWKNVYEVAYWRKVNFLHGWIVDNLAGGVDECQEIPISKWDILKLKDIVDKACSELERTSFIPMKKAPKSEWEYEWKPKYKVDRSKKPIPVKWDGNEFANLEDDTYYTVEYNESFIPTKDGFFFGGTGYDTWYAYDMMKLREELQMIIDCWDDDYTYIYQASW